MTNEQQAIMIEAHELARKDLGVSEYAVQVRFEQPPNPVNRAETFPDSSYLNGVIFYGPSMWNKSFHSDEEILLFAYHENAHFLVGELMHQFEVLWESLVLTKTMGELITGLTEPIMERLVERIARAALKLRIEAGCPLLEKIRKARENIG